jgi:hypothetical protein
MATREANNDSGQVPRSEKASLLAIVGVKKEQGVLCQHNGCNHRVYRNIHVVNEGGQLLVLGSTCIKKRYGAVDALGKPSAGGANGRQLTDEERQMLVDNTAALLEKFRKEAVEQQALMLNKLQALRALAMPTWQQMPVANSERPLRPPQLGSKQPPWPWVKPLGSVAYFRLRDKSYWVRVQDRSNVHMIMPWPSFDGWDEALPITVGTPSQERGGYQVKDIVAAFDYLKNKSDVKPRVGNWYEVVPRIGS